MRFDSIELLRYGHFSGQTLHFPRRSHDFHLIVGGNEAGKSTLRRAIHELLFGMPMNTVMDFLHPRSELALNAVLSGESGELAMGRRRKRDGGLVDGEGEKLPNEVLDAWMGGVSEAFYERMFGLDHRRLEDGSLAMLQAGDDVDAVLFQAAAGLSTLNTVLAGLREEADTLWAPRASRSRAWYAAADRYKEADRALKDATVRPATWASAERENRRLEQAFSQARDRCTLLRSRLLELERLRRLAPLLAQIRDCESTLHKAELQTQGDAAALLAREADIQQLEATRLRIAGHGEQVHQCASHMALLQEQLIDVLRQLGRHDAAVVSGDLNQLAGSLPPRPLREEIAQLLQQGQDLRLRRDTALRSWKARNQEVEDIQLGLRELPTVEVGPALRVALDAAHAAGDLPAALSAMEHQADQEAAELQQLLKALRQPELAAPGDHGEAPEPTVEWLADMQPWPTEALVEAVQRRRELQAESDTLFKRVRDAQQELNTARLRTEQFRRSHQAVSPDEVQAARRERDTLWQALLAGPAQLDDQAERYAGLVRLADMLADRQLQAEGEAARLQALDHDGERLQAAAQGLEKNLQEAGCRLKEFDHEWAAGCEQRGLPGMSPAALQGWLPGRQAVLQLHSRLQLTRNERLRLSKRHDALLADLLAALRTETQPQGKAQLSLEPLDISLPEALATARTRLNDADGAAARRQALNEQLQRLRPLLPGLEAEHKQVQAEHDAWEQRRRAALRGAGLPDDADDAYVASALGLFAEADQLLKAWRERLAECDRLQAEQAHFEQAVADLGAHLGQQNTPPGRSEHGLQSWVASLQPLRAAARDAEQARVQLARLQDSLLEEAQGRERSEVEAELAAVDLATLASESEALGQQLEDAQHERDQLAVEGEQARHALEIISGNDDAARAEAQRQEALADMAEAAERYVSVYAQYRLLEHITERYRERSQGPLLARAGALFAGLTLGAHQGLMVDADSATLGARRADGRQVPLDGLSDGTRDQLYLALRLAALELYLETATPLPFIADDLFVNYDDGRSLAGLQQLAEVSRHTQVIFLTHHQHVADIARSALQDHVHIHELPK